MMEELIGKLVKVGNELKEFEIRKILPEEMKVEVDFRLGSCVEKLDKETYMQKVVAWCFPDYHKCNLSKEDIWSFYYISIEENPFLVFENIEKNIRNDFGCVSKLESSKFPVVMSKKSDYKAESLAEKIFEVDFENVKRTLKDRVIGQEEAIDEILDWLLLLKYNGMTKDDGLFVGGLVGPSGVGKTTFVKTLAEILDVPLKKFAGSQYMEKHEYTNLFGGSKDYAGYDDQGGDLTKFVKSNPFGIMLFDEADKMHQGVWAAMTNFLDYGEVTCAKGEYQFKGIVYFTSNKGNKQEDQCEIGFETCLQSDSLKKKIIEKNKKDMPFELQGRINEFFVFNNLDHDDFAKILDIEIDKINENFYVQVELSKRAKEKIILRGSDNKTGARNLKNVYKTKVLVPIIHSLESNKLFGDCKSVLVDNKNDEFIYTPQKEQSVKKLYRLSPDLLTPLVF